MPAAPTAPDALYFANAAAFALRTAERSVRAAYEQPGMPALPPELLVTLQADAAAWAFFERQPPGYRKRMVWRIVSAKLAITRERRLALLLAASAAGRRLP